MSNPFPQGVPAAYGNAAGLGIDLGQNITGPLHTQDIPYQANWSFDIQRQLPFNLVVTAAYVGNVGVHLYTPIQFNQIPDSDLALGSKLISVVANPFYGVITDPSSTLSVATVQYGQLLRPFPQFLNVKAINVGAGHSSYEAGQLTVEKRFSQGLEVLLGYTKSKAIDNVGEQTSVAGSQSGFQDNYCFACDRSLSDQNQPFAHASRGALRTAVRAGQADAEPRHRSQGARRLVDWRLLHAGCGTSAGRLLAQQHQFIWRRHGRAARRDGHFGGVAGRSADLR